MKNKWHRLYGLTWLHLFFVECQQWDRHHSFIWVARQCYCTIIVWFLCVVPFSFNHSYTWWHTITNVQTICNLSPQSCQCLMLSSQYITLQSVVLEYSNRTYIHTLSSNYSTIQSLAADFSIHSSSVCFLSVHPMRAWITFTRYRSHMIDE